MTTRLYALALTVLVSTAALAQRNFDNVTIKTTHVAGKVHMLEGSDELRPVTRPPPALELRNDAALIDHFDDRHAAEGVVGGNRWALVVRKGRVVEPDGAVVCGDRAPGGPGSRPPPGR